MRIHLKGRTEKWIKTAIIAAINLLLWVIPSNVAYLIAQNRDVLLGRYSVAHLTWIFLLIPISIMALYLIWSNEENKKKRQFQITALSLSIIVPLLLVDLFMRLAQPKQYIRHKSYYHLAPNKVDHGTNHDVPENAFAYPQMRPGYPDIEYTLTTDKRGFRNKTNLEKYDIIALGDSFTEGSNVTDDDVWTTKLAQKSNLTVYNLGMAGSHPGIYLETLKRFGITLSPKIVLCMVYEGNDFRESNYKREDTFVRNVSNCFKNSPLRLALMELLINSFSSRKSTTLENSVSSSDSSTGSDKANTNTATMSALSWLPVAVPDGTDAKYYTFTVKNLLAHFEKRNKFEHSKGCRQAFANLRHIKEICHANNIHLVIVYAPDKSHVLLPLIQHNVPPENLRAFMALKENKLPPSDQLMDTVMARLDVQESAVKEFCRQESIGFISLTEPLREGIAQGRQLYFTYDDHWTPIGHEVVANTISSSIYEHPIVQKIIDNKSPELKIHANRSEN
jgi:hypothetical protein